MDVAEEMRRSDKGRGAAETECGGGQGHSGDGTTARGGARRA